MERLLVSSTAYFETDNIFDSRGGFSRYNVPKWVLWACCGAVYVFATGARDAVDHNLLCYETLCRICASYRSNPGLIQHAPIARGCVAAPTLCSVSFAPADGTDQGVLSSLRDLDDGMEIR